MIPETRQGGVEGDQWPRRSQAEQQRRRREAAQPRRGRLRGDQQRGGGAAESELRRREVRAARRGVRAGRRRHERPSNGDAGPSRARRSGGATHTKQAVAGARRGDSATLATASLADPASQWSGGSGEGGSDGGSREGGSGGDEQDVGGGAPSHADQAAPRARRYGRRLDRAATVVAAMTTTTTVVAVGLRRRCAGNGFAGVTIEMGLEGGGGERKWFVKTI
ncbi:hypothetical protein Scep_013956 [Stephania cephalantha]|uniref:Uncharacterized protein n=1 Tax=Stephania cephalantha TaxID=152367 RepID=A0AAP0P176_9MAGN